MMPSDRSIGLRRLIRAMSADLPPTSILIRPSLAPDTPPPVPPNPSFRPRVAPLRSGRLLDALREHCIPSDRLANPPAIAAGRQKDRGFGFEDDAVALPPQLPSGLQPAPKPCGREQADAGAL